MYFEASVAVKKNQPTKQPNQTTKQIIQNSKIIAALGHRLHLQSKKRS